MSIETKEARLLKHSLQITDLDKVASAGATAHPKKGFQSYGIMFLPDHEWTRQIRALLQVYESEIDMEYSETFAVFLLTDGKAVLLITAGWSPDLTSAIQGKDLNHLCELMTSQKSLRRYVVELKKWLLKIEGVKPTS